MKNYNNEELALLIQQGHEEYSELLWLQVVDFIAMMAGKYLQLWPREKQDLKADCIQEAWFTFMECVKKYRESQEANFITYLASCLQKPFRKVCFSGRGSRTESDLLNNSLSLDAPLGNDGADGDATMADLVPDEAAEKGFLSLEEQQFWKDVHSFIKNTYLQQGDSDGARIRMYMLEHDCTFKEAFTNLFSDEDWRSPLETRCRKEVKLADSQFIRHWYSRNGKHQRRQIALTDEAFKQGGRGYGLQAFRTQGSKVERIVIGE